MHGEKVKEGMIRRAACECKHAHIKKTVKFDVVHCKKNSRFLSSMINFITFQLMTLAHLQNGFQTSTSFSSLDVLWAQSAHGQYALCSITDKTPKKVWFGRFTPHSILNSETDWFMGFRDDSISIKKSLSNGSTYRLDRLKITSNIIIFIHPDPQYNIETIN